MPDVRVKQHFGRANQSPGASMGKSDLQQRARPVVRTVSPGREQTLAMLATGLWHSHPMESNRKLRETVHKSPAGVWAQ